MTNGRHLETIGRLILGDKWDSWKAIGRQSGDHIWETSGGQLVTRHTDWETNEERQVKRRAWEPATTSQAGKQIKGDKGRETSREPGPNSQTGDK